MCITHEHVLRAEPYACVRAVYKYSLGTRQREEITDASNGNKEPLAFQLPFMYIKCTSSIICVHASARVG